MLLQYDNPVNDITGLLITGLFLMILDYLFIDHSTSQYIIIGMILWSQCCPESNITIFNPYCCYVLSLSLSIWWWFWYLLSTALGQCWPSPHGFLRSFRLANVNPPIVWKLPREVVYTMTLLVGGIPTPLENMSSSVGIVTFPTEWKVIKAMFQTTNQISMFEGKAFGFSKFPQGAKLHWNCERQTVWRAGFSRSRSSKYLTHRWNHGCAWKFALSPRNRHFNRK